MIFWLKYVLKLIVVARTKEKFSLASYDELKSYLRALETLGVYVDKCTSTSYSMVETHFPAEFLKA